MLLLQSSSSFLAAPILTIGFVIGAILSGVAGFIGMDISVRANVRTAAAAQSGLQQGLTVAFRAGAVTGMLVAGLALLAIAGFFYVLTTVMELNLTVLDEKRQVIDALVGLAFGASLISIFARLGGGIFTKAADVGADLVGKVEAGIPEDDPRNPATIADNVGDNVGDCAGMAADLFETYVVTVGATMVLTALLFTGLAVAELTALMTLPLLVGGVCIVTSIIGTYMVRLGKSNNIMGALYKGFITTAVLSIPAIWCLGDRSRCGNGNRVIRSATKPLPVIGLSWSMMVGLAVTGLIIWITEYYTGTEYRPVRSIAKSSETGHGTNVIQGLAISLKSTALPTLSHRRGHHRDLPAGGPHGHRLRCNLDAGAGRYGRRARRLRTGNRQCWRYRRNGGTGRKRSREDRRAGRSGQHHEGCDQGLRNWLCRSGSAGAVLCLYRRHSGVLPRNCSTVWQPMAKPASASRILT